VCVCTCALELPDFMGYSRDWFMSDVMTLKKVSVVVRS